MQPTRAPSLWAVTGCVPLPLIHGELGAEDDRVFLEALVEKIGTAKNDPRLQYLSLDNADHDANTADVGPIIFLWPPATKAPVDMIDEWLNGGA